MATKLKNLPLGLQTFSEIIEENYLYIDKTQLIYELASRGKYYFLSRPRRFGKSLLISTLEAIFEGQRKLFKGLWIDQSDWHWKTHPVIRLDMSVLDTDSLHSFKISLNNMLMNIGEEFAIELDGGQSARTIMMTLLKKASSKQKVVVLIDEYDKPILNNISNKAEDSEKSKILAAIREELRSFYGVLKSQDHLLKFVMLTGITRFTKTSIFSELNNLNDISMNKKYATLLGITEQEIDYYFTDYINISSKSLQLTETTLKAKLKEWYNGYMMSEKADTVYNPFSVLSFFINNEFRNFWFESGTPKFLLELIKQNRYDLINIGQMQAKFSDFMKFEVDRIEVLPLLYQCGYITIDSYEPMMQRYSFKHPNKEVGLAFSESLLSYLLENSSKYNIIHTHLDACAKALNTSDVAALKENLNLALSLIPYDLYLVEESYYHSLFYLMLQIAGLTVSAEVHTYLGRIDILISTKKDIYVIELKLDRSAKTAMKQIKTKKYYEPYIGSGKKINLLGLNIDSKNHTISDMLHEVV